MFKERNVADQADGVNFKHDKMVRTKQTQHNKEHGDLDEKQ